MLKKISGKRLNVLAKNKINNNKTMLLTVSFKSDLENARYLS
jgi:hypothetical protein